MNHTPGPWRVNTTEGNIEPKVAVIVSYSDIDESRRPEARANARLIAAAPGMLEAIKSTVNTLEDIRWTCLGTGISSRLEGVIDQLEEVRAKAEGGR